MVCFSKNFPVVPLWLHRQTHKTRKKQPEQLPIILFEIGSNCQKVNILTYRIYLIYMNQIFPVFSLNNVKEIFIICACIHYESLAKIVLRFFFSWITMKSPFVSVRLVVCLMLWKRQMTLDKGEMKGFDHDTVDWIGERIRDI